MSGRTQIDGCEHRWFEERTPTCTALVYVDDATSQLMVVRFTPTESTFGYFAATRDYLASFGKPLAFYSDKASVFRVNRPDALAGPGYTQFGRALYELNIDGICANTPAAKGRVERAHKTLQDRLVKELRLHGISSKVTKALTLHYERKLYLLADTAANRRLIGKYIEVFQLAAQRTAELGSSMASDIIFAVPKVGLASWR